MKKFLKFVLGILIVLNVIGTGYLCFDKFYKPSNKYEATYTTTYYGEIILLELKQNYKFSLEIQGEKIISGDYSIYKDEIYFSYIFGFTTDNADTNTLTGITVREFNDSGTIKTSNNKTTIRIKFVFMDSPEMNFS